MSGVVFDVFSRELAFALDVCEQASKVAMKHFKRGVETATKSDGTPVTVADTECERLIRQAITNSYPTDRIMGEEEGETSAMTERQTGPSRRWIIDPIDGTYGYARGIPVWATLLALEQEGEIVLGVVSAPAMQEVFWAEKGKGAFRNGERIHASKLDDISQAQINFGSLNRIVIEGYWPGFSKIAQQTCRQRGFGDYLSFSQVFEGKAEGNLEVGVKPWDLAPMKVIIEEAGGKFSDLKGGQSIYTGGCFITNAPLHDLFLAMLFGDSPG